MTDSDTTPDILDTAERIASFLGESQIPVFVIGAVALAAHRYARFTRDVDLGVLASQFQMRQLTEHLQQEGYDAVFHEPDAQDPLAGVIDLSGPFGLIQLVNFEDRFPAAFRDALHGEDIRLREGSTLRVLPIPQLVALKLYAGGWKSHADTVELLRRNPDVDLKAISETCRQYRLPGFETILQELG